MRSGGLVMRWAWAWLLMALVVAGCASPEKAAAPATEESFGAQHAETEPGPDATATQPASRNAAPASQNEQPVSPSDPPVSQNEQRVSQNANQVQFTPADQSPGTQPDQLLYADALSSKAVGLHPEEVLLRSSFGGGRVGEDVFIGGQVMLWQPAPRQYGVAAALDLGAGEWMGTNSVTIVGPPREGPFHQLVVLNPPWDRERDLLIQALFGRVTDAQAGRLTVELADGEVLEATVRGGLWLVAMTSPGDIQLDGAVLRLYDESGSLLREGLLADERFQPAP